ncbi:hypothetical protein HO133_000103 [Letharia lupina]|uniref:Ankyrin repeat protein n=1 Tax=Letharia lupina TaxID=560253 RepID=A0A8H6CHG1_9LECA|nr:uncharacterized protein HO133_000103 [Letharia lupina]KAF6223261.1 hypothetical protein HO133_000103 [Letharia lupina]
MNVLHIAAKKADEYLITLLLASGASSHARSSSEPTPLYRAARSDLVAVLEMLYDAGANIDALTCDKYNPLSEAVIGGHPEVLRSPLEQGAHPSIANDDAAAVSSSSDNTSADWKAGAKGTIETKEARNPPEMIDTMTQTQLEYQVTDLPTPAKYSSPFVAVRQDKFAELSVNPSTQIGSRPQRRRKPTKDAASVAPWARSNAAENLLLILRIQASGWAKMQRGSRSPTRA